jgi:hypothetical protein
MFEMPTYTDLLTVGNRELYSGDEPLFLTLYDGLIAKVKNNGRGKSETYVWNQTTGWVRIGLELGTYQISSAIYGTAPATTLKFGWENYGWSNVGWSRDSVVSESSPVNEIYRIIRWLTEQVFITELQIENNKSLMLMFMLIQSQSNQQTNYLPWLNKTSLIDVGYTVRQLLPFKRYQNDDDVLVSGYLNEIKPYHVYIKNFVYRYAVSDYFAITLTDFDLPSKYSQENATYSSPRLVSAGQPITEFGEYYATDAIWQDPDYKDWFNNRDSSLIRKLKIGMKFDRTSTRPTVGIWNNQIYKWSPELRATGWDALPWSQVSYDIGDLVTYANSVYRCIVQNSDSVFDISNWELVQSNSSTVNAIDRIVSYGPPASSTIGFNSDDYKRVIDNTAYPKITDYNPALTLGKTISWSSWDTSTNSITVDDSSIATEIRNLYLTPDSVGASVTYIASTVDGLTNTSSLENGNSYWVRNFDNDPNDTRLVFYRTKSDAFAATNQIPLLVMSTNDRLILGQYSFATISDDISNNPYWTTEGTVIADGYAPEEWLSGILSDSVEITVTAVQSTDPTIPYYPYDFKIAVDSGTMSWNSFSDLEITGGEVILNTSIDRILMSNLPSTGVYYNGIELSYVSPFFATFSFIGQDYRMEARSNSRTAIIFDNIPDGEKVDVSYFQIGKAEVYNDGGEKMTEQPVSRVGTDPYHVLWTGSADTSPT